MAANPLTMEVLLRAGRPLRSSIHGPLAKQVYIRQPEYTRWISVPSAHVIAFQHRSAHVETFNRRERHRQPLSPKGQETLSILRQDPTQATPLLKEYLATTEEVSADVLRVCLHTLHRQYREAAERTEESKLNEAQRSEGVAKLVLAHVWRNSKQWTPMVLSELRLIEKIAFFGIIEDIEPLLREWMFVEIPEHADEPERIVLWRGQLLRALVSAHLNHGGKRRTATAALQCFFDVLAELDRRKLEYEQPSEGRRPQWQSLSPFPTLSLLATLLCTGNFQNTDPELFDRFVCFLSGYRAKETYQDFSTARLKLYRPTQPSAKDALAILRHQYQHGKADGLVLPKELFSAPYVTSFKAFLERTVAVAEANGHPRDSDWVRATFSKYMDDAAAGRPVWRKTRC